MSDTQQNKTESIETIFEPHEVNTEETLVDTRTPISNSEMILILAILVIARLEEFSRAIENRLLWIGDQAIGTRDPNKHTTCIPR